MKKQHFDIIVGKLRSSFIDAGYPGFSSTLDGGLRDLFDGDMHDLWCFALSNILHTCIKCAQG